MPHNSHGSSVRSVHVLYSCPWSITRPETSVTVLTASDHVTVSKRHRLHARIGPTCHGSLRMCPPTTHGGGFQVANVDQPITYHAILKPSDEGNTVRRVADVNTLHATVALAPPKRRVLPAPAHAIRQPSCDAPILEANKNAASVGLQHGTRCIRDYIGFGVSFLERSASAVAAGPVPRIGSYACVHGWSASATSFWKETTRNSLALGVAHTDEQNELHILRSFMVVTSQGEFNQNGFRLLCRLMFQETAFLSLCSKQKTKRKKHKTAKFGNTT